MKLSASNRGRWLGCFFALAWNGCIAVFFGGWLITTLAGLGGELSREDPDLGLLFAGSGSTMLCVLPIVLIFGAVGIFLLVATVRPIVAEMRVAHPEITLSKQQVRVGETFQLDYHQQFKKSADVNQINIKFLFRETATYQRGTDTYTVHHEEVHFEHNIPGRHLSSGQYLDEHLTISIPPGGMHTFMAYRNQLQWFVKVQVKIANWPDYDQEFEVKVVPELAGGEQWPR